MNIDTTTLIVIGAIVFSALLVDGILLGIIIVTRRKVAQAASWPSTMGTVTYSSIEWRRGSEGQSVAYPVVQYAYKVMGQMFEGRKVMPGPETGGTGAHKVVERYPAGAQVMVYYDPNNPSDAVLERSMPGFIKWLWVALIVTDLFLCGMAVVMAFAL
jgi:hypothetical protein